VIEFIVSQTGSAIISSIFTELSTGWEKMVLGASPLWRHKGHMLWLCFQCHVICTADSGDLFYFRENKITVYQARRH